MSASCLLVVLTTTNVTIDVAGLLIRRLWLAGERRAACQNVWWWGFVRTSPHRCRRLRLGGLDALGRTCRDQREPGVTLVKPSVVRTSVPRRHLNPARACQRGLRQRTAACGRRRTAASRWLSAATRSWHRPITARKVIRLGRSWRIRHWDMQPTALPIGLSTCASAAFSLSSLSITAVLAVTLP